MISISYMSGVLRSSSCKLLTIMAEIFLDSFLSRRLRKKSQLSEVFLNITKNVLNGEPEKYKVFLSGNRGFIDFKWLFCLAILLKLMFCDCVFLQVVLQKLAAEQKKSSRNLIVKQGCTLFFIYCKSDLWKKPKREIVASFHC